MIGDYANHENRRTENSTGRYEVTPDSIRIVTTPNRVGLAARPSSFSSSFDVVRSGV